MPRDRLDILREMQHMWTSSQDVWLQGCSDGLGGVVSGLQLALAPFKRCGQGEKGGSFMEDSEGFPAPHDRAEGDHAVLEAGG